MTRNEIFFLIDQMEFKEKDYETLIFLMDNLTDDLFVKILEEILGGNLFIQDFEQNIGNFYTNLLKRNLENQEKLTREVERLVNYRRNILGEDFAINFDSFLGIVRPTLESGNREFYNEINTEIKENFIYDMLTIMPTDSELTKSAKIRILKAIENTGELTNNEPSVSIDDILFFAKSNIIPLSINEQILDISDKDFMFENNLTEEQMKKIKAFSIFLKRVKFIKEKEE